MANYVNTTLGQEAIEPSDPELYIGVSVCSLGLIMNMIIISAICCCRRKRKMKPHTCFLLNIIISDIWISLSGAVFFGLKIYQNLYVGRDGMSVDDDTHWLRTHIVCAHRFTQKCWAVGTIANLLGLMLMSIDHFVAIRWSIKHPILMRKRVILSLIGSTWIVAIINGALYHLIIYKNINKTHALLQGYSIDASESDEFCEQRGWYYYQEVEGVYFFHLDQAKHSSITFYVDSAIILLVFITILCIYVYVASVVLRVAKARERGQRYSITSTSEQRRARLQSTQAKGLLTTILLVSTFVVLWSPLEIYYILTEAKSEVIESLSVERQSLIETILMVVCSCTTLVDILVYFLRSQECIKMFKECRANVGFRSRRARRRDATSSHRTSSFRSNRSTRSTFLTAGSSPNHMVRNSP